MQLKPKYLENIIDIISSDSLTKYSDLKTRLLNQFKESKNVQIIQLITGTELSSMKLPSILLKTFPPLTKDY